MRDQIFSWQENSAVYYRDTDYLIPQWVDQSFYGLKDSAITYCTSGFYYDTDRQICIQKNLALITHEFYQTTSSPVELDLTLHTFSSDWTIEFWFRW